jgi:hypothetical protein
VVDRLPEKIFREPVGDRSAGMTQQSLAQRYGISISSVKRTFNDQRLLRDEAVAARPSRA